MKREKLELQQSIGTMAQVRFDQGFRRLSVAGGIGHSFTVFDGNPDLTVASWRQGIRGAAKLNKEEYLYNHVIDSNGTDLSDYTDRVESFVP